MSTLGIAQCAAESGPVVVLSGEADSTTAAELRSALVSHTPAGPHLLTVDISGLYFADSASVRVLVQVGRSLREHGGMLLVVRPQPTVIRAFALMGVDQVISGAGRALTTGEPSMPGRGGSRDGGRIVLDQWFDENTLHLLRAAMRVRAVGTRMAQARADDVVIAVHELAANAVWHGGGIGRLTVRVGEGLLRCEVFDLGGGGDGGWPSERCHGLWLAREISDQVQVDSGAGGSCVTATFGLPLSLAQ